MKNSSFSPERGTALLSQPRQPRSAATFSPPSSTAAETPQSDIGCGTASALPLASSAPDIPASPHFPLPAQSATLPRTKLRFPLASRTVLPLRHKNLALHSVVYLLSDHHQRLACRARQYVPTPLHAKLRGHKLAPHPIPLACSSLTRFIVFPWCDPLDVLRTGLLPIAPRRVSVVRNHRLRQFSGVLSNLLDRGH